MDIQELQAAGYEVVCGGIQKDGRHLGRWGENGPVWFQGCEPAEPAPAPKRGRPKKAEVADTAEDDFSDLLA